MEANLKEQKYEIELLLNNHSKCFNSSNIEIRDKTMDDKFVYIINYDKQNFPICRYSYWLKGLNTASLK